MNELLAIFGPTDSDAELLNEIVRLRPRRVTVLIEDVDADWAFDESAAGDELRNRLAELMATIERRTGATVNGLAGDRAQLLGWRFDREVSGPVPVAV